MSLLIEPFSISSGIAGDAHFDDAESFTTGERKGVNLDWVALHEFGHSLGLDHSTVRESVMYPWYKGFVENIKLTSDDINGLRAMYGKTYSCLLGVSYYFGNAIKTVFYLKSKKINLEGKTKELQNLLFCPPVLQTDLLSDVLKVLSKTMLEFVIECVM